MSMTISGPPWDVAIPAPSTGGGSGGGGGGGASDATAVTTEADPVNGGERLLTETMAGAVFNYTYNVDGTRATEYIDLPTTDISSTYNYVDGFPYIASGSVYRGGALTVTKAQALELATVLTASGAAAVGFRVLITDLGYVKNSAGTIVRQGTEAVWSGAWWTYPNGLVYETVQAQSVTTSGESAALHTITVDGGFMGPYGMLEASGLSSSVAGTSATFRMPIKAAGTAFSNNATSASTNAMHSFSAGKLWNQGAANSQLSASIATADGWVQTTAAHLALTVDTAANFDVTFHVNRSAVAAAEQSTLHRARVYITAP